MQLAHTTHEHPGRAPGAAGGGAPAAPGPARCSVLAHVEGFGEAAIALEWIAVLAMPGGVLGAGQQQPVAVGGPAVAVVFEEAEPQLLVVRVVTELGGRLG